ncbi:hypothetical protein DERP_008234 [Dermatophagoides pteronyssinus]|uniref:Chitin-binding type-2 domain-containing protein n=1 Tax=Dermatophagoides pteronyssinus TaxID=6956 RepID=A0ABQ8J5Z2_DERPT|nr:hypothetical protein DERP_008234 [Dermatophagoides pteronyssinus]
MKRFFTSTKIFATTQQRSLLLALILLYCLTGIQIFVHGQFIHIFEVQDENRAPKSDLFDPSQYKYVSPSQLQKQQEQNKLLQLQNQAASRQSSTLSSQTQSSSSSSSSSPSSTPYSDILPTPLPQSPLIRSSIEPIINNAPQVPELRRTTPLKQSSVQYHNHNHNHHHHHQYQPQQHQSNRIRIGSIPRSNQNAYSMANQNISINNQQQQQQHYHPSIITNSSLLPNITYMNSIRRLLQPNITATVLPSTVTQSPITTGNHIPEQYDSEIRKQLRMQQQQQQQHSENRYSRTQPLRVSAQNQRQYVVRVPAPFSVNISNLQSPSPNLLPQQQLPPNLNQLPQPSQNQYTPIQIIVPPNGQNSNQSALRLSTLNSVMIAGQQDRGIPSSLLNSFLQRTQNQLQSQSQSQVQTQPQPQPQPISNQQQQQSHHPIINQPQPPYAANLPQLYASLQSTQTPSSSQPIIASGHHQSSNPLPQPTIITTNTNNAPIGRSVNGVSNNTLSSLFNPPITNKESLTDEDIKLIEEHNRKVQYFLQQRQAELQAQQERLRQQKLAEQGAQMKAQQEAAARAAAEQERIRRLKAEQEAAARVAAENERIRRLKAEQETAARAAAEQEQLRRLKAEQEASARAAADQERIARIRAEQERIQRIRAEQEAAARAAAEQERIQRIRAEQEAAVRAAAEQERIQRIRAEQEAAARAAAEQERIQRIRAEQQAAAEQEQIRRLKAEQEAAARAAADHERIRRMKAEQEAVARIAAEQERIRRLKAEQEVLEQQQLQKHREEQEMAARAAAEQERLRRIREEQERYQKLKEQESEQERQRQLRAQHEAAIRMANADRSSRLQRIQNAQELAALRYHQNAQLLGASNLTSNSLSYQAEPSLALDEASLNSNRQSTVSRSQVDNAGLVDAARIRAEKEALAEQERLLRFQASQQALAQQQAAEQNRLRRLREEESLQAEEERLAREAQEQQILRARNEQSRLINAAREAAIRDPATMSYTPYTEDLHKYQTANVSNSQQYGSLNNVRSPEPAVSRQTASSQANPVNIRSISADYTDRRSLSNSNQIDSSLPLTSKNESHFKPAKISLQELPPDLDRDGIPGVAGRDYPTLTEIPKTSFSCARQPLNGYYADTETACQVVHMCQMGGVQDSFICPNGTIWNQEKFACQWWYEVNCATAPTFYALNNNLYKGKNDGKNEQSSFNSASSSSSPTSSLSRQL